MLDAGNSGTGYYCCTWLASSIQAKSVMTGDYQICYRPAGPLVETANALGAKIVSTRDNGLAPLWIKGGIRVTGSDHLKGQVIDCSGMPDTVPILAVYGCACKEGKTVLTNIRGSRLNYSVPAAPGSMGPLYLGSAMITVF